MKTKQKSEIEKIFEELRKLAWRKTEGDGRLNYSVVEDLADQAQKQIEDSINVIKYNPECHVCTQRIESLLGKRKPL